MRKKQNKSKKVVNPLKRYAIAVHLVNNPDLASNYNLKQL